MTIDFSGDLYARKALRDPYPFYREIRDAGPAVYMPRRGMWAIGRFDIRPHPRDHVGRAHGAHSCVGMHLARLEADTPEFAFNNVLQGFRRLPMRFHAV